MIGLETAFAVASTELGADIKTLVQLLSTNPARIAGIGDPRRGDCRRSSCDLAIIDLDHEWTIKAAAMASRSANTPFEGRTVRGKYDTRSGTEPVVNMGEATR